MADGDSKAAFAPAPGREIPTILGTGFGLVVGFYFSWTNHSAIGGIGDKPKQEYQEKMKLALRMLAASLYAQTLPPIWPGAVATNNNLLVAGNGATATLAPRSPLRPD